MGRNPEDFSLRLLHPVWCHLRPGCTDRGGRTGSRHTAGKWHVWDAGDVVSTGPNQAPQASIIEDLRPWKRTRLCAGLGSRWLCTYGVGPMTLLASDQVLHSEYVQRIEPNAQDPR